MSTPTERAESLLRDLGAETVPHPGGTLLTHLRRVRSRLAGWNARPALQLAGLCHAFYGTDGFPTALLPLDRRGELVEVIGAEAESIVYFYGACDREATYPNLAARGSDFRDRFTGRSPTPDPRLRRDLAELTAANELDLADHDPAFRERHGADLLALFHRFRPVLSQAAWQDCLALGGTGRSGPDASPTP
ncbi:hypothetical protein J7F01_03285 [Streptomyces sp. ISL-22]|uniref:DUF6817 domain-containing protein n=1 Tax=unclassified Streptomyces TaxID=2593676 RepID=UPI001BECDD9D|nr:MULTISPECIES: hypothetical protein [unclassified Streptomyces]MBT2419147.1 hypothetical protein [Streptomyces sp. ISL-24]MBT2431242.1 hypothetical protein [Streptomyces sp. ISL-22]